MTADTDTTPSPMPTWLQTANRKRCLRDEAIQKFLDTQTVRARLHPADQALTLGQVLQLDASGPTAPENGLCRDVTHTDQVGAILQAISARAVTASQLCSAYIGR